MNIFCRFSLLFHFLLISTTLWGNESEIPTWNFESSPPDWVYDAGPDRNTKMGQELIELTAAIPNFPEISKKVMSRQKFRPAYGPIPFRMRQEPNSVKILFIGQDGTHIAEAAGRPATAGFGGRAHDLANHFGVDYSAAFINTYAFTINRQYGDRNVPFVWYRANGDESIGYTQFISNELWLMSQDQKSPITQWRNKLIDWIIRNNRDSLKMIVTFGGSARDSIASYIESKPNGKVATRKSKSSYKNIKIAKYKVKSAGGNNSFPVPINKYGDDLYEKLFYEKYGKKPNYKKPHRGKGAKDNQNEVKKMLQEHDAEIIPQLVLSEGGLFDSGVIHPAQIGGYDINKIHINNEPTISLNGIPLDDGTTLNNDILVFDLHHPTYLSNYAMTKGYDAVADIVEKKIKPLENWRDDRGWQIPPDHGMASPFFLNCEYSDFESYESCLKDKRYQYGRGDIGQEYYDFGTPKNRMVAVSSAKRLDRSTILLGARESDYFSQQNRKAWETISKMKYEHPASPLPANELFTSISRTLPERDQFDPGPGYFYAKIMKDNLNLKQIFKLKPEYRPIVTLAKKQNRKFKRKTLNQVAWQMYGNDAFYVTSSSAVADFGHYRGTFENPRVVIIADPEGWDDIITARALTGWRGQYLHGLMKALGVYDNYLVIKTVPFGMDGASEIDWNHTLEKTENYRNELLNEVLANSQVDLIITDGPQAEKVVNQWQKTFGSADTPTLLNINRSSLWRNTYEQNLFYAADMRVARSKISRVKGFTNDETFQGERANIPSSHLSYFSRVWEGTSGDRVISASGKNQGLHFVEVVPNWVTKQRSPLSQQSIKQTDELLQKLCMHRLPLPKEKTAVFMERKLQVDFPNCQFSGAY